MPVSVPVRVIRAPGITAPFGSRTVPRTLPASNWPNKMLQLARNDTKNLRAVRTENLPRDVSPRLNHHNTTMLSPEVGARFRRIEDDLAVNAEWQSAAPNCALLRAQSG